MAEDVSSVRVEAFAPAQGVLELPGESGPLLRELCLEVRQESASEVRRTELVRVLAEGREALYRPDYATAAALDTAVSELLRGAGLEGERLVKGWPCVFHNAAGKEQERLLLATTEALYRVHFDFVARRVLGHERTPWCELGSVSFGPFAHKSGAVPSLGGLVLRSSINRLYGVRVFARTQPSKPPLPLPFAADRYVDRCYRTFRPRHDPLQFPDEHSPELARWVRAVTHEIALALALLARTDPAYVQDRGPRILALSGPETLEVSTPLGLIAAVHNKAQMGLQAHPGPQPVPGPEHAREPGGESP